MIRIRLVRGTALGTVAFALLVPCAALAQSENRLSADASVTAGYSNNPFTQVGSGTGSGLVTIDIAPRYQRLTERTIITVSADANLQQYLRGYGRNDSYSGALDYQGRPSEKLTTHARLDLSSAVLGAFGGNLPIAGVAGLTGVDATAVAGSVATVPVTTVAAPLVPITDVGLFGLRNRRRSARLSGDAGLTLSARDTLRLAAYGEVARYSNLTAGDYQAYGGTVGYSRRVSDRLNAGLQGTVSVFDYRIGTANSRAYSIQATASDRLSDRWTADGALGVSFVDGGGAFSTRSTSLSGNGNLCRRGQLSTLCLQAARQVSPTGLSGSQYVTTAGVDWTRQLSEHDSVSLSGSYSKVGSGSTRLVGATVPLQTQYAQALGSYTRLLRQRLRLIASVDYRQLLGGNVGRPVDFGGQVGLSYRIGDKR